VQGVVHNVLFVATERLGVCLRREQRRGAVAEIAPSGERQRPAYSCDQVSPVSITSTPVIDRSAGANGTIYLVAMSKAGTSTYHQRLHALDVTTGAELPGGPVEVSATYPVLGGTTTFEPAQYEERAALLLSQGVVYTSWTSHCDVAPYSGWVIGFSQGTLARTTVLNVAPNSGGSGPAISRNPAGRIASGRHRRAGCAGG
jgi:hypothetical protein